MAWKFDHSFTASTVTSTTEVNRYLAGEGGIVWAVLSDTSSHRIHVYAVSQTYTLKGPSDSIVDGHQEDGIFLASQYKNVGYVSTIASSGDKAYVGINTASMTTTYFDNIKVLNSWGEGEIVLQTPVRMHSNIVVDNGKLWMTSYDIEESGQQQLYAYNLTTRVWSKVGIPVRHQEEPRFIARDHNGFILVCDYNNLSISKFTNAGAYVSTTRLAASAAGANRQPNFITIGDDRSVYIASFQGMISKFDSLTDTVTSFSNGLGDIHSFVDDGTYLWVAAEKRPMSVSYNGTNYTCFESHMSGPTFDVEKWALGGDGAAGAWASGNYYVDDKEDVIRIKKSNNQIRHFGSSDRDIQIENPGSVTLAGVKVNSVLVTPSYVCATTDGNVTIPKYVWAITDENKVTAFPITAMHRPNYYQMQAVAMMSYGPYDYIGE